MLFILEDCPIFTNGDGIAVDEFKIGAQTVEDCINGCIERRQSDTSINGVTVHKDGGDCWCEKGMTGVDEGDTEHKTCFMKYNGM